MSPGAGVSVIISTHNRAPLLARLLDSLASQTVPAESLEVVVVDDGSTDGTRNVVRSRRKALPRLRCVGPELNVGLASAANLGARAASGEKLLYLDDDCIPRRDWFTAMARALDESPFVAGAVTTDRRDFLTRVHNISTFHRFFPGRPPGPVGFLAGANFGITRAAFDAVGGFEEGRRTAHDMEFTLRARALGIGPRFHPEAVVLHAPTYVNLRSLFGYAYRHAKVTIGLRRRHRDVLGDPWVLRGPVRLTLAAPAVAVAATVGAYVRSPGIRGHLAAAPLLLALKLTWCLGAAAGLRKMRP